MAARTLREDKTVAKFIEKIPFPEKVKQGWVKTILSEGLSEELVETIHEKLAKLPHSEKEGEDKRGQEIAELTNLVRVWRIAKNKDQFHSRR
jgi:hypothetical protein